MQAADLLEMAGIYLTVFSPFWVTLLLWLRWRRWLLSHLRFAVFCTMTQTVLLLSAILCVQELLAYATSQLSPVTHNCRPRVLCDALELFAFYRPLVWIGVYSVLVILFDLYLKRRRPGWFGFAALRRGRRPHAGR